MAMTLERSQPATHDYDDPDLSFRHLVRTAGDLDLPDGLNAEVFGGTIVVSPWSKGLYSKPMLALLKQLNAHAPEGHAAREAPFLFEFANSSGAAGPDVYVVDLDMIDLDSNVLPGQALSLVAELTSNATRENDLGWKLDIYGTSGVPVYLLFDMKEKQVTVYSKPSAKGYREHSTVEFGKPVHVPAPFEFGLDTSAFKRED
ncbi:Uma2 family endonuclease [Glycomyces salinus]|uniref:Uma2 family endonuclease n=1 Tax=Glycomyces salinus TaxID=980294 RepID=UPI0018EB4E68|nr:Uma2 family endonuclease [Glycomyces salinus]